MFAPENGCLEDSFPFGMAYFQGRIVSFREGNLFNAFWDVSGFVESKKVGGDVDLLIGIMLKVVIYHQTFQVPKMEESSPI